MFWRAAVAARAAARVRQAGLPPSSWRRASARRRYRWASCSQVKPMPPSTWMQSFALSTASSSASAAAAAAASGCSAGESSAVRAASQARAAARSARQAMVAHRCLTAWNSPIGRPNCLRVLAYSAAVPLHQAATPAASAAYRVAARSRTLSVRRPGRRFSGGMTASASRTTASSREKSSGVRFSTVTPGWSASSRNHASPSAPSSAQASRWPAAHRTGPVSPVTRSPPSAWRVPVSVPGVPGSSATHAVAWACARAGRSFSWPQRASRRQASAVGSTGPGARAPASCSSAAARSVTVPPSKGMSSASPGGRPPATPRSWGDAIPPDPPGPPFGGASWGSRARTRAMGLVRLAQSRRDDWRARCSCVMAIGTNFLPFV